MPQLKIALVTLGNLKYPIDVQKLEKWKSKILKINHGASVGHLENAKGENWEYTDEQLQANIKADSTADFTLALIDAPIEDNYYLRRLSDNVAVLSLNGMLDITQFYGFSPDQYILRNLYELSVLFTANQKLTTGYQTWAHDETRGCLFDMNANRTDIVFSLHRPRLCEACSGRVSAYQLPALFLSNLKSELNKIKKPLFVRMLDWVRMHPIAALALTAISGVILNLIASVIFEVIKGFTPGLK